MQVSQRRCRAKNFRIRPPPLRVFLFYRKNIALCLVIFCGLGSLFAYFEYDFYGGTSMKKWIWAVIIALFAFIIWQGWTLYDGIMTSHAETKNQAATKAKKQYDLNKVLKVSEYHGSHAYHVVKAIKKNKKVFIWIPDGKGKSFVKAADKGWSKHKVKKYVKKKLQPKQIIDIHLGVEDEIPLWEVIYKDENNRYTFYYLRFKDGVWYKKIHL